MNDIRWDLRLLGERRRSQRVMIGMGLVILAETWAILFIVLKGGRIG